MLVVVEGYVGAWKVLRTEVVRAVFCDEVAVGALGASISTALLTTRSP